MTSDNISFNDLGLPEQLLKSINEMGYEKPSPIQIACIPQLLNGRDVLGMAQTGSGKTAAFALPFLANIDPKVRSPQVLVLAPTRELAIQVADACSDYAKHLSGIKVLAVYGGQRYDTQLKALRQGVQIVVGTPGRLLDHLNRKTLDLSNLKGLVLDEADEMLRMGFIDDVETIMAAIPAKHQTALFSATMPDAIRRITRRFMNDPFEIKIQSTLRTAPDISQSVWSVYGMKKSDALVRFLEVEDFDATIIFVKTKSATLEVAEVLERNDYNCAALNGDMNQATREQTLERLRNGKLDILIATDVAARGLDVDRISLVVNYDIPMDAESYVHRIGRTGRAGRAGRALLFVENRERRLLRNIERLMKITIPEIELPSGKILEEKRLDTISAKINNTLKNKALPQYRQLITKLKLDGDVEPEDLLAALLKLAQGERSLILPPDEMMKMKRESTPRRGERMGDDRERRRRSDDDAPYRKPRRENAEMDLYRIEIGRDDGVEVRHIVGAIANEGDISSRNIGNIKLFDTYSTIELPKSMPKELLKLFTKTRVLNKQMKIQFIGEAKELVRSPKAGRKPAPKKDRNERRSTKAFM